MWSARGCALVCCVLASCACVVMDGCVGLNLVDNILENVTLCSHPYIYYVACLGYSPLVPAQISRKI